MGWSPRCCTTGEISGDRLVSAWKRSTTRSTHLLLTFSRWRKPCWLDTLAVLFRYRCEIFPHLTTHRSGLTSIRVNERCNFAMSPIFFFPSFPLFFFFFPMEISTRLHGQSISRYNAGQKFEIVYEDSMEFRIMST